MTEEEFFAGHPFARRAYGRVRAVADDFGPYDVRITRSQIALRRRRGFAYVWIPGRYLRHPGADVVLSVPLGRHDRSPRFKEVAHPAPAVWMHHLELTDVAQIDDQVRDWLREAWDRAG